MASKSKLCVRLALVIAMASSALVRAAIPERVASEFQVNTYTSLSQLSSDISSLGGGEFVVVWVSLGSSGSDTVASSIQGQIYDADGQPIGGEFQVNTYTSGQQFLPAVGADDTGNFLVTWTSDDSSGPDRSDRSIQGQLFDPDGQPIGGEFQVNTYTTSNQRDPDVAFDGDQFIVVWSSDGSAGSDNSDDSIQAQRFDSGGQPVGGEFQVNTFTYSFQAAPEIASDGAGNFLVVWESLGSGGSDASNQSVQGRLFGSGGVPVGADFQINTYTTSAQWFPRADFDAAGNFLVVWRSFSSGSDTSGSSILGQRFNRDGLPIGGEFLVNTYTPFSQIEPAIASNKAGSSVVAWAGFDSTGSDTSESSIHGQIFGSGGLPIGDEFQVNTYTRQNQLDPEVTFTDDNEFVVVWSSRGSGGSDTSYLSIQGQRYGIPIFCDGFESGDFSAWKDVVP